MLLAMLTVTEYHDKASAICGRANERLSEEMPDGDFADGVAFAEKVARDSYDSLALLQPPAELAELHREMLVHTQALLVGFASATAAAKQGMAEFARVSAEQSDPNQRHGTEVEVLWRRLGVPECNH